MRKNCALVLSYQGSSIRKNDKGMVNLTDMWRAEGSPKGKPVAEWLRSPVTQELVDTLSLNMGKSHVLQIKPGRGGGTWVTPSLAVSYAKYLSPKFHAWANQAIIERLEEEADPELAYSRGRDRARRGWQRQGHGEHWIQQRISGIEVRHSFTDALKEHSVVGIGYSACTNAIYRPVLGGSKKEVVARMNLPANANLRDNVSMVQLSAVQLAESLAEERIDQRNVHGNDACERICFESGSAVSLALNAARNPAPVSDARFRPLPPPPRN